jgi:hypothetical protein
VFSIHQSTLCTEDEGAQTHLSTRVFAASQNRIINSRKISTQTSAVGATGRMI